RVVAAMSAADQGARILEQVFPVGHQRLASRAGAVVGSGGVVVLAGVDESQSILPRRAGGVRATAQLIMSARTERARAVQRLAERHPGLAVGAAADAGIRVQRAGGDGQAVEREDDALGLTARLRRG